MGVLTVGDLIKRAVLTIRQRYYEPLRLDDLARSATMSKFYFARTFHHFTGTTPGRFLSAVRIHEAKRLLLLTSCNVSDISVQVGYGSLGAFSRRFTECVGLAPTAYRRMVRGEDAPPDTGGTPRMSGAPSGVVSGTVHAVSTTSSPIFLGLFQSRIPLGRPVASTAVSEPGPWQIPAVPPGTWYLLAAAMTEPATDAAGQSPTGQSLLVSVSDGFGVRTDAHVRLRVIVRPPEWRHPPLLVALPGVEGCAPRPTRPPRRGSVLVRGPLLTSG